MGLPPSYLFVVRHGNRLDTADKRWHLTSPAPYDPPLTYGGFLQARQVGIQIASILEQARAEEAPSRAVATPAGKRKRFKVVIHSSPFLRCVQTSIGISSGLSQRPPDASRNPADLLVPVAAPNAKGGFKSAILRLDSFLGEWMSPEYFEMITPPPGSSLMLGAAKAELLKREDYSKCVNFTTAPPSHSHTSSSSSSLWSASPTIGATNPTSPPPGGNGTFATSALSSALPDASEKREGYVAPRPAYAVSSSGKIPDGFVSHARDECLTVDYQWESMRAPQDFGDGGSFGEEWTAMHKRFRTGIKKMVNWYWNAEAPEEPVSSSSRKDEVDDEQPASVDEEVETVVIVVSHGAGCNALIGAITHQPVLLDVGIASITMAVRKSDIDPHLPQPEGSSEAPLVQTDQIYDIRLSASTEHLHSTTSTPMSSRTPSMANVWIAGTGNRGRTSTLASATGPVMGAFTFSDPFSSAGNRSTSLSAVVGPADRRASNPSGPSRQSALSSVGFGANGSSGGGSPTNTASPSGLWAPTRSSLRLMDDGANDEDGNEFDDMLPSLDQKRFRTGIPTNAQDAAPGPFSAPVPDPIPAETDSRGKGPRGPVLAAPIKLQTNIDPEKPAEEVSTTQLGDGLGGLWGIPPPPDDAERFRDLSHTKRRWTFNELT